jgi:hypothetical protein
MNKYTKRAAPGNSPDQFDLFEWLREADLRAGSPAARRLANRFSMSIHVAIRITELNGLGAW